MVVVMMMMMMKMMVVMKRALLLADPLFPPPPPLGESSRFSSRQLLCHKHAQGTPRNIQFYHKISAIIFNSAIIILP